MKINPRNIFWRAPTERTDGSTIPGDLNYDIGVETGDHVQALAIIVGNLQTDGLYQAPLSDFSFEPGVHTIALRATEVATGLTSAWSNTASFEIVAASPQPPLAVAVG